MTTSTKTILLTILLLATTGCIHKSASEIQTPPQHAASPVGTPRSFPPRTGLLNDLAGVFDASQESRLEEVLAQQQRDHTVEFVVVTVATTNGEPLFDYSLDLARSWKPGGESGRGLLLVLAIKDREWRLQVSRALEAELPNDVCKNLAEPSLEFYRQGRYAEGVERYVRAIGDHLAKQQP